MSQHRRNRGTTSYQAGLAAEEIVAQAFARKGQAILAKRWRGSGGEIDVIAQDGEGVVFVEVKKSKTHTKAAQRITHQQMQRIYSTGAEFLETMPKGQLTDVRIDVALVDEVGRVNVIENAYMAG